jgi:hypothetical protein
MLRHLLKSAFVRRLEQIGSQLESRVISRGPNDELPYLHRYFLQRGRCYLHRFVDDDPGPEEHDHPWGFSASLVLVGGYFEYRNGVKRELKPGQLNIIHGSDFHRVELHRDEYGRKREAWSLFFHTDREKVWGFKKSDGHYDVVLRSIYELKKQQEKKHADHS